MPKRSLSFKSTVRALLSRGGHVGSSSLPPPKKPCTGFSPIGAFSAMRSSPLLVLLVLLATAMADTGRSDSYLNAYKLTHDLNTHAVDHPTDADGTAPKVVYVDATSAFAGDGDVHPIYVHNHIADDGFHPVHHEEEHQHLQHVDVEHHYLQDVGTYGPSIPINNHHKKPSHVYGPPAPVYVPPTLPPSGVYGPPHHKIPPLTPTHTYYEPDPPTGPSLIPDFLHDLVSPHAFLGVLDKIKLFKLDLYTIGKLILKFVIFKKILMFLTILFLLLVIPSLKKHGKEDAGMMSTMMQKLGGVSNNDDDDDEEEDDDDGDFFRRRSARMYDIQKGDVFNAFTARVLDSIESFERKMTATKCSDTQSSVYCKSQSVVDRIKALLAHNNKSDSKTAPKTSRRRR